jgi:hypothetical protein
MRFQELVCGTCGAINRDALEPCWRCLERLEARRTAASGDAPEFCEQDRETTTAAASA